MLLVEPFTKDRTQKKYLCIADLVCIDNRVKREVKEERDQEPRLGRREKNRFGKRNSITWWQF